MEIKNLRLGEFGRVNLHGKEARNLIDKRMSLKRKNRKLHQESRDYKTELKVYEKCTN